MKTALSARNLAFSYAKEREPVLSGIDLELQHGTVNALLGANGVGKTTLLRLLLGLVRADAGQLFLFGKQASDYEAARIKQIMGMVSQDETIPFDLSVLEYVILGRAPHLKLLGLPDASDRKAAENALAMVGMTHMGHSGITRLSSGERQLANMARALAQDPDILLLDEPCSHLDLMNTRQVLGLMQAVARNGKTVVFTTHDPNAASAVAHQVILLRDGRIVSAGPPEKTLTRELLTLTYGGPVEVVQTHRGPLISAL